MLLMVIATGQDLADHLNIQSNAAALLYELLCGNDGTLFRRMFVVLVVRMMALGVSSTFGCLRMRMTFLVGMVWRLL